MTATTKVFSVTEAKTQRVPILVSVPHSGTQFPEAVKASYFNRYIAHPEDADWYVDWLYNYVGDLGITMISAHLSRYVIDLNRSADNRPLYSDGRQITELVPTLSFAGEPLLLNRTLTANEINDRLKNYYWPYYQKVEELLLDLKSEFGCALLLDAHSIKRMVPSIQSTPFPDMILGDADGTSASKKLSRAALEALEQSHYSITYNQPFKGGNITRHFGRPDHDIHALQLEMSQEIYMDESECEYVTKNATKVREALTAMFNALIRVMVKK